MHPSRECTVSGSIDETPDEKGWARVRVLVAYEEAYRSYQEAIVRAIKDYRSHFVVLEATPRELEAASERFGPHAVLSSRPSAEYSSGGKGAWVELPTEPAQRGDICIGGEHEGAVNLGLKRVLSVLDEAEERLQRGTLAESC